MQKLQKLLLALFVLSLVSSVSAQSFRPRHGGDTSFGITSGVNRSLELRVLVDHRSAVGSSHDWMQALADVGADRVVAETSRVAKPSFQEFGSGSSKTLSIIGVVKQGKLHLPGGKFTIRQTGAIRAHLKKLRDDGAEITIADKVAFGLTAKQLLSVHDQLGARVETSTEGQNAGTLADSLLKKTGYRLSIDRSTQMTIDGANSVMELELAGYSTGTALALTLRQLGLVFEPIRPQGQNIQLLIRSLDDERKNWPVGWPVSESIRKAAPQLFVRVDIQAQETPILDLLDAIESRIEIPFCYDRAKISASGLDLEDTRVNFLRPGKKSSYDMVIDKVLNQCKPKMKSELRIDEVGKRFLWITTRK